MNDKLKDAYLLMQENCGIEVGDTVKVLRDPLDYEQGWDNDAVSGYAGKTGVVSHASTSAGVPVNFEGEAYPWHFPWFVLEKLPKPHWRDTVSKENPVLCYVRDDNVLSWCTDPCSIINFDFTAYYGYETKSGFAYKYAKRVPREMIEKLLAGYDETSEDEQCGLN